MLDVSRDEITEGNLPRALVFLAMPLVAQSFVRVGEAVIDLFWLGRLSGEAVAGVGLAESFYILALSVILFAPMVGTQILVSQRVGADDYDGAQRTAFNGIALGGALGVVGGVAAFLLIDPVVGFLTGLETTGSSAGVERVATQFLQVIFLGVGLAVVSDVLEMVYIAHGDSKTSLYMNVLPVLVNVTLDPLLIFGVGPFPRLEIYGAALATVVSWGVGLAFGVAMLRTSRGDGLFSRAQATVDSGVVRELLDLGLPVAGQHFARQAARFTMVVVAFIAGGGAGVAAYYVGARIAGVSFVPAGGLKQALQSVVGQNTGAEHPDRADRATRVAFLLAVGFLVVVGALQWLFPGAIVDVIAPTLSGDARAFAVQYLVILAYGYPAIGAAYMFEGGFNGVGRTKVPFVSTVIQFYAVRLPIGIAGAFFLGFGVQAVFWAVTISNVVIAVGLGAYYQYSVMNSLFVPESREESPT